MGTAARIAPVLATALLLRSLITAVPPAMSAIRTELGLSEAVAGLTVGLPVVCFGVFAFVAPVLLRRFGAVATMSIALVVLTVGALLRPLGSVGWLLVGTAGIGIGVAIGNVLVPVMVRRSRPADIPRMMGYYSVLLAIGATVGSLLTGPLLDAGVSWQAVLFGWAVFAAALTGTWLATTGRRQDADHGAAPASGTVRTAARQRRTWLIVAYMGLQSAVFYGCITWLPTQLGSAGFSVADASLGLALFNAVGMVSSFYGPRVVTGRGGRGAWTVLVLTYIAGFLLVTGGGATSWLGVVLLGLGQGVLFTLALTFIAHTADPRLVGAVSSLAQGCSYLLAAVGPSGFGALHSASGSWWPVQVTMAVTTVVVGALGLVLLRPERPAA
ncbi:MAG: MFS transporter [Actinobacteria bacterium]|nr:MFS transporter [Actinomycetota bacterium]